MMGHADIRTMLNIYAKAVPGWQEQAAAKLDAYLDGATGGRASRDSRATVAVRNRAVESGCPAVENRPLEPKSALRRGVEPISNPRSGTEESPAKRGVFACSEACGTLCGTVGAESSRRTRCSEVFVISRPPRPATASSTRDWKRPQRESHVLATTPPVSRTRHSTGPTPRP